MIPLSDRPPRQRTLFPYVTVGIMLANIAVFVYQLTLSPAMLEQFVRAWGVVPIEILSGSDVPPRIPYPVHITLLTSMFIHGGFLHIAGNMLYLWIFGDNVEDAFGHLGFLAFYLICGIAGSLLHVFFDGGSQIPSVGASGAISGILGAYIVFFPTSRVLTLLFIVVFVTVTRISAAILIGVWFLLQLLNGVAGIVTTEQTVGVAYLAHIGGFVTGAAIAFFLRGSTRLADAPEQ